MGEEVEKRRLAPAKGVMSGCQAAENGRRGHMKTSTRGCKVGDQGDHSLPSRICLSLLPDSHPHPR